MTDKALPFDEDHDPFERTGPAPVQTAAHRTGYRPKQTKGIFEQLQEWDGKDPEQGGGQSDKKALSKPSDETRKIIEHYTALGWFVSRIETKDMTNDGMVIKTDWCGFGDFLLLKPGPLIRVLQVTTEGGLNAHIQKVSNRANVVKYPTSHSTVNGQFGKGAIFDNLQSLFACGGEFVIATWYREGREWRLRETPVTPETVQAAIKRQRK